MATELVDKIIDNGHGGKLLEITESRTITIDALKKRKQAIAKWREECIEKHIRKLNELDNREEEIDTKIAMFSKFSK